MVDRFTVCAALAVFLCAAPVGAGDAPTPATSTVTAPAAGQAKKMLDEAYALFFAYHTNMGNIQKAIDILENAIKMEPNNAEAYRRISRIILAGGDMLAKEKKEKIAWFTRGEEMAKKAIEIEDNNWESHFWYMANHGRIAQTKGLLSSLFMLPEIQKHMDRAIELNPKAVLALDAKGVMYYELPWIKGGDTDKSIEWLKKACDLDPNFTLAHLDLAKSLVRKKMYKEARVEVDYVLNHKTPTYMMDWAMWDVPKSKELLVEIEEHLK